MLNVFLKNTTSSAITVAGYTVYYIDGTDAEIVTVYDANDVEYNAFKYTANGTDYYYVLDGVQENWTNDLASIGYREEYAILLGLKWNVDETELEAVTNLTGYRWSRVISQTDKDFLNSLGLWIDSGYKYGSLKFGVSGYSIKLAGVYTGIGEGAIPLDSNWEIRGYTSDGGLVAGLYYDGIYTSTPITTWKVRIRHLQYHWQGFINASGTNEYLTYGDAKKLYDDEGAYIIGDSSKIYTLVGVYDENYDSVPYTHVNLYVYNNRLYLAWNSSAAYVAGIDYIEF